MLMALPKCRSSKYVDHQIECDNVEYKLKDALKAESEQYIVRSLIAGLNPMEKCINLSPVRFKSKILTNLFINPSLKFNIYG